MLSHTVSEDLALEKPAYVAEINYDKLKKHTEVFKYKPLPKFAEMERDLALVTDLATTCAQIEKEIYGACKYVTDVKLFDVYSGSQIEEGKKSMAFTVKFTPKEEAITPENVDNYVKKILNTLKFKLGVILR